ncbi:hypothetical protein ACJJTC_000358 [Scirpophaga incertulas]
MENYVQYTTMGSVCQIRMRSGCLPKKFACQPNRPSSSNVSRPVAAKRRRLDLMEELDENISSAASQENEDTYSDLPGTSSDVIIHEPLKINKAVQTSHVTIISAKRRSEASQTMTKSCIKQIQTSPLNQPTKSISTSPFKVSELKPHVRPLLTHSNVKKVMGNDDSSDSDVSLYTPSVAHSSFSKTSSDTSTIIGHDIKKEKNCELVLKSTLDKIEKKPQFYIGVPKNCYFLIKLIQENTGIPEQHILLCLKKIRLDSKSLELGDDFGITGSYACRIFRDNVSKIAEVMRPFIVNLDKAAIKRSLPIAFRKNYTKITCIIDCLEIEIQKPSKALHQALTWSDYKKANTIKYLISSTPNGLVNYVSPGYGGRTTDVCVVQQCDFLKCLPSGSHVMADRGFKHIEPLLLGVGCQLVRPPSVQTGKKLSKEEVKQTKQIASLRIHIERLIRRLREYSMLKPHACINNYLIGKLDDIVVTACGLVNLQKPLINK